MKKNYETPFSEIICFEKEDIVGTSEFFDPYADDDEWSTFPVN